MILLAEKQHSYNVNGNTLFNYVTNMENYKAWFPGVVDIRSTNDFKPHEVGKQYIETIEFPQGTSELIIEVKEVQQNKKFLTEADFEPLFPRMTMFFYPANDNVCIFKIAYESRNPNLTNDDELIVAIKKDINERAEAGLTKLGSILEDLAP